MTELPTASISAQHPALTFAKVFNIQNYPIVFTVDFDLDAFYITPKADELYKNQPYWPMDGSMAYRDYKKMVKEHDNAERMRLKKEVCREHFEAMGITDYCMFVQNYKMTFHFKNNDDLMKAVGGILPEQIFEMEFLTFPEDVPHDYLEITTKRIQDSYDKADLEKAKLTDRVKLHADFTEHSIRAQAKGIDIPTMMDHAKKFELALSRG